MPVEFQDFRYADHGPALTVEAAIRFYANQAQIHDFQFDDLLTGLDFELPVGVTGSVASGIITAQAGGSSWVDIVSDVPLPADHTIYAVSSGSDNYLGFVVGENADHSYRVCNEGTAVWKVYKDDALVWRVDHTTSYTGGTYHVTCRPFPMGDGDDDLWLQITLWRGDAHILTYTEKLDAPLDGDYYAGVAVRSTASRIFSSLRVPELCLYAEYGTSDPGEELWGGYQRAMEGRYVRQFVRFDGTLAAFRPKAQSAVVSLTASEIFDQTPKVDLRVLRSHVRMMGAYEWGEALDPDLVRRIGHRFIQVQNPMLMSESECVREAERQLRRFQSEGDTSEIDGPGLPLIEPEDRIDTADGAWVVTGFSKDYPPGAIEQTLSVRRYLGDV